MPSFATSSDHTAARAIEKWKIWAGETIESIRMFRNSPDLSDYWIDEREFVKKNSYKFKVDTQFLVGWIGANNPNLDPKPLMTVAAAIDRWWHDENAAQVPQQLELAIALDQSDMVLEAVLMAIFNRSSNGPAAKSSPAPTDLRSAYDYRVVRKINTGTLNKARESGRIKGYKIGGRWFYSEAEVRMIYPEKFED